MNTLKKTPWWILNGVQNPSKDPDVRKKISNAMKGRIPWIKGKHHSPEAREVMAKRAKERWKDNGYRERMCKAFKGRISWNKGKKGVMPEPWNKGRKGIFSKKTLERMSQKRKGRTPWNKGISHSMETKRKISEALEGKFVGKNNPMFGKHHSTETLKKLSERAKEREKRYRTKGNHPLKGRQLSEETKNKIRKARMKQIIPFEYTSIELAIEKLLNKLDISYIHSFNLGDKFLCDFAIPQARLIIECDGDYWHSLPDRIVRDKAKDAYAKKCGWEVLRLPGHQIVSNIDSCKESILSKMEVS